MSDAVQFLVDHDSLCESFRHAASEAVSVRILAAWATCGAGIDCLRDCPALEKRAIIGTTFAITEPEALHSLMRLGFDLRVVDRLPNGGLFHPKVYLFERTDGLFTVLLGSANLTNAAFARNAEVVVHASLPATAASQLVAHFEKYWSSTAALPVTDDWFQKYNEQYANYVGRDCDIAQAERAGDQAKTPHRAAPRTSDLHDLMLSDWIEYVRTLSSRTDMQTGYLDAANDSYLHTLSLVTPLLRAGLASADHKDIGRILGRHDCGWLGTVQLMRGRAAKFGSDVELRALVDDSLRYLWSATSDADCFAGAEQVFRQLGAIDGFGPGFITRILAIARPDRFFSYNKASCNRLASLFGIPKSRLESWDGYQDGLRVVYSTRWYRSPMPESPRMKRLWNARVALLDAYAYQVLNG